MVAEGWGGFIAGIRTIFVFVALLAFLSIGGSGTSTFVLA
jgi:hypothetical protein